MMSPKDSQRNLNTCSLIAKTYREEGTFCDQTARLDLLEDSINEIQELCSALLREKNECNDIRTDTAVVIQDYQLHYIKVQQYIDSCGYQHPVDDYLALYTKHTLSSAEQYLKSHQKSDRSKGKSLEKSGQRSKILKRLDKSIKSPSKY